MILTFEWPTAVIKVLLKRHRIIQVLKQTFCKICLQVCLTPFTVLNEIYNKSLKFCKLCFLVVDKEFSIRYQAAQK